MEQTLIPLTICRFEDVSEQDCFFFQVPEESMMVFRKCGEHAAECIDNGAVYVFSPDVAVSPQQVH